MVTKHSLGRPVVRRVTANGETKMKNIQTCLFPGNLIQTRLTSRAFLGYITGSKRDHVCTMFSILVD